MVPQNAAPDSGTPRVSWDDFSGAAYFPSVAYLDDVDQGGKIVLCHGKVRKKTQCQ
jgi:hypothetical protein